MSNQLLTLLQRRSRAKLARALAKEILLRRMMYSRPFAKQAALDVGSLFTSGYAAPSLPLRTSFDPYVRDSTLAQILGDHIPTTYAQSQIIQAPNVSFEDKVRMLSAVNSASAMSSLSGKPDNILQMKDLLPALAGAGLGYLGAALAAPIFGFTPSQKRMFNIGGAALGAILNTMGR